MLNEQASLPTAASGDIIVRILLVGEESAGIQLIRAIAPTEHEIVAVMTSPIHEGRRIGALWKAAQDLGYPVWPSKLVKDSGFEKTVRAEHVDILLNVHSLHIINSQVVDAPAYGSFNLHPGPLPRYAGLNGVSWALYQGECTYGVTLHKMAPEIDTGPIVYQSFFPIEADDTALSLTSKCVKAGLPLVLRLLEVASKCPGAVPLSPQDLSKRQYFGREVPNGGRLSWSVQAREIIDFVRACDYFPFESPWGYPRSRLDKQEIAIVKASRTGRTSDKAPGTVGECVGSGLEVASADEWVLVSKVMIDGRYVDPAHVIEPGSRLEDDSAR